MHHAIASTPPGLPALLQASAAAWGTTPAALRARQRPKLLGPARQAFVLAAVRHTANSYRVIGEAIGRDHSSVMTAESVARQREARDPAFAAAVRKLGRLAAPDHDDAAPADYDADERICDECGINDVDTFETRDGRFICDDCRQDEARRESEAS